jgi:ribonuclease P/MRP protein subunit RPP40
LAIDDTWLRFKDILDLVVVRYVPLVKGKRNKYPQWMTREAKRARKYKVNKWKEYRISGDYNDLVEYKLARKRADKEYRKAKRIFEERIADNVKSNPKGFYAYVRSKTTLKEVVGPLRDKDRRLLMEHGEMCNELNTFFASVFTKENLEESLPPVITKDTEDTCGMRYITTEVIYKKLKQLKVGKAAGIDGIATKVLIECAEELCKPFQILYNRSLKDGIVPKEWKLANVSALYKKGSKELAGNYIPVSLTSHVGKVMESVIKDVMVEYLMKNELINASQHGFVKGKSCLTNHLEFFEKVTEWVDNGEPVDVTYLDFQKAFDKVPHKRLLHKVKDMGIEGDLLCWLQDWLKDRKQRVCLAGECSEWAEVTSGVPQGSVLGPLLFLIYINDIDEGITNKLLKFADDTKLFGKVGTMEDIGRLREDLVKLVTWSKEWLMLFNVDKCKVMHVGHNNPKAEYKMEEGVLQRICEEMDLGIIVQDNLKCAGQCAKVVKTANRVMGMIKRTFGNFSRNIIVKLYKSLIRPRLQYAIQAWRPHLKKDIDLIESVQRRVTRLVVGSKGKGYEDRLQMLGLKTLETRRIRGDLIEVFKILRGIDNVDERLFFSKAISNTRGHDLKLYKHSCRLDCRK